MPGDKELLWALSWLPSGSQEPGFPGITVSNTDELGQQLPSCRRGWLLWPEPTTRQSTAHEALNEQCFRL